MAPTLDEIKKFVFSPGNSYFSGNTTYEKVPQRPGFFEIVSKNRAWEYRDSYTGHFRSRGMEVVRYEDVPVWTSLYGGGMIKGFENLAAETFEFLKEAFKAKGQKSESFRGPDIYKNKNWTYSYRQEGDIEEFNGYEEIQKDGIVVFFHRIIGGIVVNK